MADLDKCKNFCYSLNGMNTSIDKTLKNLEELVLKLDIEPDKEVLTDILEILKTISYVSMSPYLKKLFQQFEIFTKELRDEEIPLNKESVFVLELLLKKMEAKNGEKIEKEIEDEDLTLILEFLQEGEDILKELKNKNTNPSSLLHRLKGIIGIYINICEENMRPKGKDLLKKVITMEEKSKSEKIEEKDVEALKAIFEEIKEHYGRI